MSFGSGTIEGNTFTNSVQPIRGPYDNSQGGLFVIRSNVFTTTGNREACTGVTIDGTYQLVIERNTVECFRGLRLSGHTQAIVRDNVIDGNPRQGVLIGGSAVVSLSGNTVTNNGLSPGTEPAGGVVVWETGQADLGGGALTIGGQTGDESRKQPNPGQRRGGCPQYARRLHREGRSQLLGPPGAGDDPQHGPCGRRRRRSVCRRRAQPAPLHL